MHLAFTALWVILRNKPCKLLIRSCSARFSKIHRAEVKYPPPPPQKNTCFNLSKQYPIHAVKLMLHIDGLLFQTLIHKPNPDLSPCFSSEYRYQIQAAFQMTPCGGGRNLKFQPVALHRAGSIPDDAPLGDGETKPAAGHHLRRHMEPDVDPIPWSAYFDRAGDLQIPERGTFRWAYGAVRGI